MKKSILGIILSALALVITSGFLKAQTLTYSSLPNNVQLGSSPTFNLSYTSTVSCKISVALYVFDVDGSGNLTPDWNSWKAGSYSSVLPSASAQTPFTTTLAIPASLPKSSDLPSGKTYVWALGLTDANDGWITGGQYATTLVASSVVTDNVNFGGSLPTSVNAGSTYSIPYQYTASTDRIVKIGLSKYNSAGNWIGDVVSEIVNAAAATSSTPVSGNASLTVPNGTTPSNQLPNGETYKWEATIATTSWGYIGGTSSTVSVTGNLAVNDIAKKKIFAFGNPVKDVLRFSGSTKINAVRITDMSGKVLMDVKNENINDINLSSLSRGLYIITINGTESQKLIKE